MIARHRTVTARVTGVRASFTLRADGYADHVRGMVFIATPARDAGPSALLHLLGDPRICHFFLQQRDPQ
jgi:hypothetical protein